MGQMFAQTQASVMVCGLDRSGKSLVVRQLLRQRPRAGDFDTVMPTASLERSVGLRNGVNWTFLEVSAIGARESRALWRPWVSAIKAVVFVVDAADCLRLSELAECFSNLMDVISSKKSVHVAVVINEGRPRHTLDGVVEGDYSTCAEAVAVEALPARDKGYLGTEMVELVLKTKSFRRHIKLETVNALKGSGCDRVLSWLTDNVSSS